MTSLTYLCNFWEILKIPLINFEINLTMLVNVLTWCANFVKSSNATTNWATIFSLAYAKLYVPAITLSTQDNTKNRI